MALGRSWQHGGWQRQGTGRHRGDDLGCDGGQWWRRRSGWGHRGPAVLGNHFVMTWKKALLNRMVLGLGWLRCKRLSRVGQGAGGWGVRREAEGRDIGRRDVEARILRSGTGGAAGGLRVEVGCQIVRGQTGGKAVRRFQGGADRQVLFICHDGQSVSHQAVGHTSICLLSNSTADTNMQHMVEYERPSE